MATTTKSAETRAIQPLVLSEQDISSLPTHGFPEPGRIVGGFQIIFASETTPTDSLTFGIGHFPPRTPTTTSYEALHRHTPAEFYHIVSGQMIIFLNGTRHQVEAGGAIYIPGDAEHGFCNPSTEEELVFSWGFATDGFSGIEYRWSEEQPNWAKVE